MKQVYTSLILLIALLFSSMTIAQESQKGYINYQGVARNSDGNLMNNESLTVGVKIKFGASAETVYEESHSLNTDANGVFSLLIGNGNSIAGDYNTLPWGSLAAYATVSINGTEIGTTEMMSVPHALSSADNQWHTMGDDIENKNGGNVFVTGSLYASKDLSLAEGAAINEFSTDITLAENSDAIVPTQKAIKTYVDNQLGGGNGGILDADSDSTNEIQTLSFDAATNELSISDGNMVTIPSGGTDADADPTNELQDISLTGTELTISDGSTIDLAPIVPPGGTDDQNLILTGDVLSIENGSGSIDLSTYAGDDADADPNNEIQDITLLGTELTISNGSTIDLAPIIPPGGTDDQNADEVPYDNSASGLTASDAQAAIDELASSGGLVDTDDQALLLIGDILTIEDGAGSVDLSTYKDEDVTTKTGILLGDGTAISGLVGTADGQVAKWNAGTSKWEAGTDATGGGGSSLWTDNGGDIYYNSGRVGIGASNPFGQLQVSKASGGAPFLALETTAGDEVDLRFGKEGVNPSWNQIATIGANDASSKMDLSFYDGGTSHSVMTLRGNRRMGINNPNPQTELDVAGEIRSSDLAGAGERNVMADANGNLIIGDGSSGSSLWSENGSNIYRTGGSVGIGAIPNTDYQLHLNGSMLYEGRFLKFDGGPGKHWTQYISPIDGSFGFAPHMTDADGFTPRFKLARTGELELGTEARRQAWLHIPKNSTVAKPHLKLEETENDYARLELTNNSNSFWHVAGLAANTPSEAKLNFYFNNTSGIGQNHMTITGAGNVGIGGGNPTAKFHIFQGGQNVGTGLRFSDGTVNKDWDITHGYALRFHYGGDLRGYINATTGAYVQSSDARLKSNVQNMGNVIDKVLQIRPATYNYKSDKTKKITLGLIAQEVQPLFPELVTRSEEDDLLGIDYGAFSIVAIKAIQEQQQIIKGQSEKISDLEERLLKLEAKIGN